MKTDGKAGPEKGKITIYGEFSCAIRILTAKRTHGYSVTKNKA